MKKVGHHFAVSSLSCETDFVTGTDLFRLYLNNILDLTLINKKAINENDFGNVKFNEKINEKIANMSINDATTNLIANVQENCIINFIDYIRVEENQLLGYYLHLSPYENLGIKASYCVLF